LFVYLFSFLFLRRRNQRIVCSSILFLFVFLPLSRFCFAVIMLPLCSAPSCSSLLCQVWFSSSKNQSLVTRGLVVVCSERLSAEEMEEYESLEVPEGLQTIARDSQLQTKGGSGSHSAALSLHAPLSSKHVGAGAMGPSGGAAGLSSPAKLNVYGGGGEAPVSPFSKPGFWAFDFELKPGQKMVKVPTRRCVICDR